MQRKMPRAYRAYFLLLGALAALCIGAGVLWFAVDARRQPAAPQYLLKDNAGHVAL